MNSKKLYYILRSVWVVIILLVMLIFMNRDFSNISAEKKQDDQETRLNIALVNEDAGVNKKNIEYNLGSDYVKKIEKDTTYNWFTVSRGIAENGLKNGTYNLLVTIPSNFSSKLLEIDDQDPEKLQINYKVNANGNATLENESRSVGRKIVNDLNQQLVDLYVASIIDNLYTAQKNIEKVYTNQTESVGSFNRILYDPTTAFKSYFPSLASYSESALQSNDQLKNALSSTTDSAGSLVDSQKNYSTVLEELVAQRAEGKLTYEDFVQSLLSLDTTLSSQDTDALFKQVSDMNQYFQTQFASTDKGEFFVQTDALNEQLAASKEKIAQQQEKLAALDTDFYNTYKEQFFASIKAASDSKADVVTLKDVLQKKDTIASDSTDSVQQFEKISQFNTEYLDRLQSQINSLPYLGITDSTGNILVMDGMFSYQNAPYWSAQDAPNDKIAKASTKIIQKVNAINEKINAANARFSSSQGKIATFNLPEAKVQAQTKAYVALEKEYKKLVDQRTSISSSKSFSLDWNNVGQEATLKVTDIPASVAIESVEVSGSGIKPSKTEKNVYTVEPTTGTRKITIKYTLSAEYNEAVSPGEFKLTLSQPGVYGEAPNIKTQPAYTSQRTAPVDASDFLNQDYQKAKVAYSEELGQIYELYDTVNAALDDFENYPFEIFHTFLDMPVTDVFKTVLTDVFKNGEYKKQEEQLTDLMNTATQIEAQKNTMQQTLEQVYENSNTLNEGVTSQLALLKELVSNSAEMSQKNQLVTSVNNATDSQIDSIATTLKSILQQSEQMKQSSEANVSSAESVKTVFDSFDNQVKSTQQKGDELSANATTIKQNLDEELKNNDDFVSAFTKVLNNAHKDGVPNNTLMQFIANPINGKAETTIKTTEINEPFTWILIMFTLSLFIAYLFATQPVVKKVKDRFKREKLWLKDNTLETALLSLSGVGIGVVLGILSSSELGIKKEAQLIWVVMIVLFMLIFSLVNHYLLKQFHITGFALSLFLFISYVFVTNAIGKTKGNNPMVDLIRMINPLSIGEANLADILANDPLNVGHIILYLLAIAALIVFNIFIWKPRRERKEVVKN